MGSILVDDEAELEVDDVVLFVVELFEEDVDVVVDVEEEELGAVDVTVLVAAPTTEGSGSF